MIGIISMALSAAELEAHTTSITNEIGFSHLAPLEHHMITVQIVGPRLDRAAPAALRAGGSRSSPGLLFTALHKMDSSPRLAG